MRSRVRAVLGFLAGFEAAARTLSFTLAAAELNLTQSAISRQIKALEEALGVVLFERFNRRLALTEAGEALRRTVGGMLRDLDEGLADLAPLPASNEVSVTTSISFASLWLVPQLAEFRRKHPSVEVRISADNSIVDLRAKRIDLAVRFCRPDMPPAGAVPLFGEEVFPVCAPGLLKDPTHPLRTPRDLAHHVLLSTSDVNLTPWLDWSQWLVANGAPGLKPAHTLVLSHYDQLISAAVDGVGVALGRTPLIQRFTDLGKLVAPFRGRAASPRNYFLVTRPGQAQTPAVKAFAEWITRARPNA
jgi:LysR family transcriptional regulator, glycine cleavage system transcriptional activator